VKRETVGRMLMVVVIGNSKGMRGRKNDVDIVGTIEKIGGDIVMRRMRRRVGIWRIDDFGEY
jgi:hypothetical protein